MKEACSVSCLERWQRSSRESKTQGGKWEFTECKVRTSKPSVFTVEGGKPGQGTARNKH